ncbi:MAG: CinA family protein [Gammaproteobacteria bacterium]|nr:MAG: CinA family protein [Gammaproteobacteria bacterium]
MANPVSQTHQLAKQIGDKLKQHHLLLATAESCTGGQLAQTITSIPGTSAWFERGFITYSNLSKQQMLGVNETLLNQYGPVSEETAIAMATGALNNSAAQISISITGIAGPNGGTEKNPVGTLWTAWVGKDFNKTLCQHHSGDRLIIRYNAVEFALQTLLNLLNENYF